MWCGLGSYEVAKGFGFWTYFEDGVTEFADSFHMETEMGREGGRGAGVGSLGQNCWQD